MTHYVFGLSLRKLLLKTKKEPVYFFSAPYADSVAFLILRRIPIFGRKVIAGLREPDVILGAEKGLFYRVQEEALECTDFLASEVALADHRFVHEYNRRFGTGKFKPFVLKWTSFYVLDLIRCLHRVRLHRETSKVLHLDDTLLNRRVWDWWSRRWGAEMEVCWHRTPEIFRFVEALAGVGMVNIIKVGARGICLRGKRREFRLMKEAVWGVGGNPTFRDDFFIDGGRLHKEDLLLYCKDERWRNAFREGLKAGYVGADLHRLKVPVTLLCGRLFREYIVWPVSALRDALKHRQSSLVGQWLMAFHAPALEYEILLAHYKIRLELSKGEETLRHIPETIVLNRHGARSAIFHWSDLAQANYVSDHFKAFNLNFVWGPIHWEYFTAPHYFVDRTIETGCWLVGVPYDRALAKVAAELDIPDLGNRPVIAFYDNDFNDDLPYTEEVLLQFWEMIEAVLRRRKEALGILKLKVGSQWYEHAFKRVGARFARVRERCLETGRLYFIDPSLPSGQRISLADVIALSTLNITLGVCTPSTLALLHGKAGIYYDTTGNEGHPFARLYKGKLVFDRIPPLLETVDRVLDEGYQLFREVAPDLMEQFDRFRDGRGLERFASFLWEESCEGEGRK